LHASGVILGILVVLTRVTQLIMFLLALQWKGMNDVRVQQLLQGLRHGCEVLLGCTAAWDFLVQVSRIAASVWSRSPGCGLLCMLGNLG
jgi:hypothetical protein